MRRFKLKGDPEAIEASGALDLIRKMKSRNPLDYDARDHDFMDRFCARLQQDGHQLDVPDRKMAADARARLLVVELHKGALLKELE